MKNIIIFGGTFDPIHKTHLNMAASASEHFNNALIYFVPARIPRWKKPEATPKERKEMVQLCLNENKNFKLSDYELKSRREINYSYDTVIYFKNKFPNDKIYFLIGGDQVNQFDKWYKALELSKTVQIIYIDRKNVDVNKDNVKKFNMLKVPFKVEDGCSTDIRNFHSIYINKDVSDYISNKNLYYFKKIKEFYQDKRYAHVKRVARLALEIAEENNLSNQDIQKVYVAALLHDIAKKLDSKQLRNIIEKNYPKYKKMDEKILHQFAGAYLAKKEFEIDDKEILNSITFHTTGHKNMSKIEKIIYCADKIEPGRDFDNTIYVKKLKKDIDTGFIYTLSENLKFFLSKKINFQNSLTEECLNFYLGKHEK